MESYKNRGGDSGVTSYEITVDLIKVEFLEPRCTSTLTLVRVPQV